jgi:alcohol dehydrogenase (NADP+)
MKTLSYAAQNATTPLAPFNVERRNPGADDVQIQILYCGVCHSDLHTIRNEWQGTTYPCVPGHEIIGRVTRVGTDVKKFKEGDIAAVGCLVDSCRTCENCKDNLEQFCEQGPIFTYNSPDKHTGGLTYGGYSNSVVVDEAFVLQIPKNLDLAATAPLLCAGITTYSPLRHNNVTKGQKVGIVGLGGLGHMGVKLAKAFGAHVVVFTTPLTKLKMPCGSVRTK